MSEQQEIQITDKRSLQKVLDKMIFDFPKDVSLISICRSLANYDDSIEKTHKYKGVNVQMYSEEFAMGRIVVC
jgi:hypothetical protein